MKGLMLLIHDKDDTNKKYKENFNGVWKALVQQCGNMRNHIRLISVQAKIIADSAG